MYSKLFIILLFSFVAHAATPNMGLSLPTVGSTTGPTWATMLNTAFTTVDSHDHSSGKGVQITPSGLNINANLSIGSNQLTNVAGLLLVTPSSQPSTASDIYQWSNELWFNNTAGSSVQITNSGHLNASAINTQALTASQLSSGSAANGLTLVSDGAGGAHFAASAISATAVTKTSNYTITTADSIILCDATSGQVTLTLPSPTSNNGKLYWIKKIDSSANQCTVVHSASENIDGFSAYNLKVQYQSLELTTDGSNWYIL